MKAVTCKRYGSPDVLQIEVIETPAPQDDQVLVKVHAASVNAGDWHLLRGDPFLVRLAFGLFRPKFSVLGADIAGTVEAVGANAERFQPGDEVFGDISECGFGAFAEYACVPESVLVSKPENISFEAAAAVPAAAVTALQALRDKGSIQSGKKVLINGASGGVGTFAVQIARAFDAEVTAVCSTGKLDLVRSLGAEHAIDYTQEDFTASGKVYDIILAANGHHSIFDYRRALAPKGIYVTTGGTLAQMFQAMLLGPVLAAGSSKKLGNMLLRPNCEDLEILKELLEAEKVVPVIDRRYPLEAVPDAIRYLEEGHARGKVVITFGA
jgi:NADPH:quinone reductase-like Zn-dependent oxidoreductase